MIRIRCINEDDEAITTNIHTTERQENECLSLYRQAISCSITDEKGSEVLYKQLLNHNLFKEKSFGAISSTMQKIYYLGLKNLGIVQKQQGKHQEALQNLVAAAEKDEKEVLLWYNIAETSLLLAVPNYTLARIALEKAILLNPQHWFSIEKLVDLLFTIGDEESCTLLLQESLKIRPHWAYGKYLLDHLNKKETHSAKRQFVDSIENLKEVRKKRKLNIVPVDSDVLSLVLKDFTWVGLGELILREYKMIRANSEKGWGDMLRMVKIATDPTGVTSSEGTLQKLTSKRTFSYWKDKGEKVSIFKLCYLIDHFFGSRLEDCAPPTQPHFCIWPAAAGLDTFLQNLHKPPNNLIHWMEQFLIEICKHGDSMWGNELLSIVMEFHEYVKDHCSLDSSPDGWFLLTLAELLFDKSQDITLDEATRQHYLKESLSYIHRIDALISRPDPAIPFEYIDPPQPETVPITAGATALDGSFENLDLNQSGSGGVVPHRYLIRFLWLRGLYAECTGNEDSARAFLEGCEAQLVQNENGGAVWRPNCLFSRVVSLASLKRKREALRCRSEFESAPVDGKTFERKSLLPTLDAWTETFFGEDRESNGISAYDWKTLVVLAETYFSLEESKKGFDIAFFLVTSVDLIHAKTEDLISLFNSVIKMLDLIIETDKKEMIMNQILDLKKTRKLISAISNLILNVLEKEKHFKNKEPNLIKYRTPGAIKTSNCLVSSVILLFKLLSFFQTPSTPPLPQIQQPTPDSNSSTEGPETPNSLTSEQKNNGPTPLPLDEYPDESKAPIDNEDNNIPKQVEAIDINGDNIPKQVEVVGINDNIPKQVEVIDINDNIPKQVEAININDNNPTQVEEKDKTDHSDKESILTENNTNPNPQIENKEDIITNEISNNPISQIQITTNIDQQLDTSQYMKMLPKLFQVILLQYSQTILHTRCASTFGRSRLLRMTIQVLSDWNGDTKLIRNTLEEGMEIEMVEEDLLKLEDLEDNLDENGLYQKVMKRFSLSGIEKEQTLNECTKSLFGLNYPFQKIGEEESWDSLSTEKEVEMRGKTVDILYLDYWPYVKKFVSKILESKDKETNELKEIAISTLKKYEKRFENYFAKIVKHDLSSLIPLEDEKLKDMSRVLYFMIGKYYKGSDMKTATQYYKKDIALNPINNESWLTISNYYESRIKEILSSIEDFTSVRHQSLISIVEYIKKAKSAIEIVLNSRQEESERAQLKMRLALLTYLEMKLSSLLSETKQKMNNDTRKQFLETIIDHLGYACHLSPKNWVYQFLHGRFIEKLNRDQPEKYLPKYKKAADIQEPPSDSDKIMSIEASKKKKEKHKAPVMEPLLRLQFSRFKILTESDWKDDEKWEKMMKVLEPYNFTKAIDKKTVKSTSDILNIKISKREEMIKNIIVALEYAAEQSAFPQKIHFALAKIYYHIGKLKKARTACQNVVFPEFKIFLPKIQEENYLDKQYAIYFHYSDKEMYYQQKCLHFYITLCQELEDYNSLGNLMLAVSQLDRVRFHRFRDLLETLYAAYLKILAKVMEEKDGQTDEVELMTSDEDEEEEMDDPETFLLRAYVAYLHRGLFKTSHIDLLDEMLITSYKRFVDKVEFELKVGDTKTREYILSFCRKRWPKMHEKRITRMK